jgi:hypothetical protein
MEPVLNSLGKRGGYNGIRGPRRLELDLEVQNRRLDLVKHLLGNRANQPPPDRVLDGLALPKRLCELPFGRLAAGLLVLFMSTQPFELTLNALGKVATADNGCGAWEWLSGLLRYTRMEARTGCASDQF